MAEKRLEMIRLFGEAESVVHDRELEREVEHEHKERIQRYLRRNDYE